MTVARCAARGCLGAVLALSAACGRGASPSVTRAVGSAAPDDDSTEGAGLGSRRADAAPSNPREVEAWERAVDGDEDELGRLAAALGCDGLRERAAVPALRQVALRAMGACEDFTALGWLGEIADRGNDADAVAALDAIAELASRRRRAVDPDDAEDFEAGCRALLHLARDSTRPKVRRVRAVRALRMLNDRGCLRAGDIPDDLDGR